VLEPGQFALLDARPVDPLREFVGADIDQATLLQVPVLAAFQA